MKKGFRYWWEDHKRIVLLLILLGALFVAANLEFVELGAILLPDSAPVWLVLLLGCLAAALLGLLLMALTTWLGSIVLLVAQGITNIGLHIAGVADKNSKTGEGAAEAAAGLAVAYWIGYRFYLTWIK